MSRYFAAGVASFFLLACDDVGCPAGSRMVGARCIGNDASVDDGDAGATGEGQNATMSDPTVAGASASGSSDGVGGMSASTPQPPGSAGMSDAGHMSAEDADASAGAAGVTSRADAGSAGAAANANAGNGSDTAGTSGEAGSGAEPCAPSNEECDNTDNDCDSKIDEAVTRPCGSDVGICEVGMVACRAGQWDDERTQCMGGRGPAQEVCDTAREDENCDDVRNEGCDCVDGETQACGNDTPPCSAGTITCVNGAWPTGASSCKGAVGPKSESCDGVDNDCNASVDDRAPCSQAGTSCRDGRCVQCTSDSECSNLNANCKVGACSTQGRCEAKNAPDTVTTCSLSSGSGVCQSGQCRECITSAHCRGRSGRPVCSQNQCVACTATEGCGNGQICTDGQCVARCGNGEVDSDEQSHPGAGSGWDLSSCTNDCKRRLYGDCSSNGVCVQGQTCSVGGSNICTKLFCTGADCASVPGFTVACTANSLCEILCNGTSCPNGLRCVTTGNGVQACVR